MEDLQPPFVSIDGIANVRDIGGWPVADRDGHLSRSVRKGIVYRGPDTSPITDTGIRKLRALGITTVFDLRSKIQIDRAGGYQKIEGIQWIWCPVFGEEEYTQEKAGLRYQQYAGDGTEGIVKAFTEILLHGSGAFRTILLHIASLSTPCNSHTATSTDHLQPTACFVNCTTGNNRTGPFTGILLSLLHVPTEQIATEYALSDKGLAPIRSTVVARLVKNPKFAAVFGDEVEQRAMRMVGARPETMFAMLEMVNERWGSAEGYVKKVCGLTDEEIGRVRRVLIEERTIETSVGDLANNYS